MASRDAFDNDGQNHHTGNTKHGTLLGDTLDTQGHNNNSNIYVEAIEHLNSLISVVNLAKETTETGGRDLQMHQTIQKPGMTQTA